MKRSLILLNNLNKIVWSRIVRSTSVGIESLCVFRMITGFFLLTIYSPTFGWIGRAPKAFFDPPVLSLASFVGDFPGTAFFVSIDLALLGCILCIILGIKARLATLVYVVLSFVALNFQYSFGKIDHTILLYLLLICMSFSGWGTSLSLVPDRNDRYINPGKSLSLLTVLLCFSFFSAGFDKALHWINFDFNKAGSASWFYPGFYTLDRVHLLAPFARDLPFSAFKLMDYAAVLFELSPLVCALISRKAWRLWLLIACFFHTANLLILNIPFIINSIIYLAFIDYSSLYAKLRRYLKHTPFVYSAIGITGLIVIIRIYNIATYKVSSILFIPEHNIKGIAYFSLCYWTIVAIIFIINLFKRTSPLVPEKR